MINQCEEHPNPTLGLKDHDPRPGKREAAAQKLTRPFAMQPSQPAARWVKNQRGNPGGTQQVMAG